MELFACGFELAGERSWPLRPAGAERGRCGRRLRVRAASRRARAEPIGVEARQQRAQTLVQVEGQAGCLALAGGELPRHRRRPGRALSPRVLLPPRRGRARRRAGRRPAGRGPSPLPAARCRRWPARARPEPPDRSRGVAQAGAEPRQLGHTALSGGVEAPEATQRVGGASERGEADHGPHTRFGGNAALPARQEREAVRRGDRALAARRRPGRRAPPSRGRRRRLIASASAAGGARSGELVDPRGAGVEGERRYGKQRQRDRDRRRGKGGAAQGGGGRGGGPRAASSPERRRAAADAPGVDARAEQRQAGRAGHPRRYDADRGDDDQSGGERDEQRARLEKGGGKE